MVPYGVLCLLVVIETIWIWRMYMHRLRRRFSYQNKFSRYQNHPRKPKASNHPATNHLPPDYLAIVENPTFHVTSQRIFNKPEARIFYAAKNALKTPGFESWHVHGQTSLGELFRVDEDSYVPQGQNDRAAPHSAFNSKRSDMVITDNFGMPRLMIEYQGSGHSFRNDPIKKTLFRKAGVSLMEIDTAPDGEDRIDVPAVSREIVSRLQEITQTRPTAHIAA